MFLFQVLISPIQRLIVLITPNTPPEGWWYQNEPTTIKVLVFANNDPNSKNPTVQTLDFGTYCKNTLPNEWEGLWPAESLKVGAICVRSYAWYSINYNTEFANYGAAVDNTTRTQVYKANTEDTAHCDPAFAATTGVVVNYWNNGTAVQQGGFYNAGGYNSNRDSSSYNFSNKVYQDGTEYLASQGESYTTMLSYYYPGTGLVTGNGF